MQTRQITVPELRIGSVIVEHANSAKPRKTTVRSITWCPGARKGVGKVHINQTTKRDGSANHADCYDMAGMVTVAP